MKQYLYKTITIIGLINLFGGLVFAQNTTTIKKDSTLNKRAQSVFAEYAGPAILYSLNYDTRFSKKQDGLGMRIGISYIENENFPDDNNIAITSTLFSIPLQFNYLLGKDNKFFEIGLGFTYFNYVGSDLIFLDNSKTNINKVLGTMTFGYRYQPKNGGLSYRASINPFFDSKRFRPWWVGVSIGYAFNR